MFKLEDFKLNFYRKEGFVFLTLEYLPKSLINKNLYFEDRVNSYFFTELEQDEYGYMFLKIYITKASNTTSNMKFIVFINSKNELVVERITDKVSKNKIQYLIESNVENRHYSLRLLPNYFALNPFTKEEYRHLYLFKPIYEGSHYFIDCHNNQYLKIDDMFLIDNDETIYRQIEAINKNHPAVEQKDAYLVAMKLSGVEDGEIPD